jgi:hypothetical protein
MSDAGTAKTLARVGVTIVSLLLAVGAAVVAVRLVGSSDLGDVTEGTPIQLAAFIGTLAVIGGLGVALGLNYVERHFQRSRRKSRRSG